MPAGVRRETLQLPPNLRHQRGMLSWFAVHASIAYLPGAVLPVPTGALSASVRPRLAARAVPAPSMGWVDDQHSFRYEKAEEEVDVSEAAERAKCLAGPSPDLQPLDVLDVMLRAFKRGYWRTHSRGLSPSCVACKSLRKHSQHHF